MGKRAGKAPFHVGFLLGDMTKREKTSCNLLSDVIQYKGDAGFFPAGCAVFCGAVQVCVLVLKPGLCDT
ncbi:hypothetical protein D7X33_09475 [Butyricicoccus sp. 1XD8-22]|nr:hypothetical protein D7X33_09475 [Butyricicoccus sp. 1XD8-22]